MNYHVVYDGNCNLCVTFTKLLAKFDRGQLFDYITMQDITTLEQFGITERDCDLGMILIDANRPEKRWQGSNAAEEIARLLPLGDTFIAAYRSIPGMKWLGDRTYERVRDNRYSWFGQTDKTYHSDRPFSCQQKPQ